ncbi:MAG: relaxase/mobilization nuclease domain-containing protein [Rhizobiales bacterium]|nr:relaxase/mobilization nuclease domain-containing protein [Hyphomicrobiales bacterium]
MNLGRHLLKQENEHVEEYQVRGFMADNVMDAMKEAQAIAQGTKCKQHVFSLSLNPPESETVSAQDFEKAADKIGEHLGLGQQPRIIVIHEKEGRRHAHCVWSRIKTSEMKAVQLSHYKNKLQEKSRELFLEHGWKMPNGLLHKGQRNPLNFTLSEWQQAKRMGHDAKSIKSSLQDCWSNSDDKASFIQALKVQGYYLARGDRRGFVAVTYEGEVLSLTRMVGKKSKTIKERLGDPNLLLSVEKTKRLIAHEITPLIERYIRNHKNKFHASIKPLNDRRKVITKAHRNQRTSQKTSLEKRWRQEQMFRSNRFRKGLRGIWDRVTGNHSKLRMRNEKEVKTATKRDDLECHALIVEQMTERRQIQYDIKKHRLKYIKIGRILYKDIEHYRHLPTSQENHTRQNIPTLER